MEGARLEGSVIPIRLTPRSVLIRVSSVARFFPVNDRHAVHGIIDLRSQI
jgi:hypothetical protein